MQGQETRMLAAVQGFDRFVDTIQGQRIHWKNATDGLTCAADALPVAWFFGIKPDGTFKMTSQLDQPLETWLFLGGAEEVGPFGGEKLVGSHGGVPYEDQAIMFAASMNKISDRHRARKIRVKEQLAVDAVVEVETAKFFEMGGAGGG